jgi:hypothetical protein
MLDATWDQNTDAYYFSQGSKSMPVVKTIDLGARHVLIDVDPY